MEGGNSGQAPCLPTLALGFGPDNRLPIRRQNEACPWATDLDTVAAWLHNVEEDGLLNGMLVWAVLDTVPELNGNIRSAGLPHECLPRSRHGGSVPVHLSGPR